MGRWRREGKPCRNGRGYAKSEGGGGEMSIKKSEIFLPSGKNISLNNFIAKRSIALS